MTDRLTPDQIAEIAARAKKATSGPWDSHNGSLVRVIRGDFAIPIFESRAPVDAYVRKRVTNKAMSQAYRDETNNTTFIAHAREDIPALLAHVRAVEAERDAAVARASRLEKALRVQMHAHQTWSRPVGAEGSTARLAWEDQCEADEMAREALRKETQP